MDNDKIAICKEVAGVYYHYGKVCDKHGDWPYWAFENSDGTGIVVKVLYSRIEIIKTRDYKEAPWVGRIPPTLVGTYLLVDPNSIKEASQKVTELLQYKER